MEEIAEDMGDIHDGILDNGNDSEGSSQESVFSVHMADAGTDSFEQEKNYILMGRESEYYKNLELALDRTSYAAGSPVALAVRLSIEAGWHTNSNQPTFNNLIATEVKLDAPPEWEASFEVRYPPGQMKTFGFVSDPISVYEGVVFFHGDINLPSAMDAGPYPLRSSVIYQACDDKICLAPVTVEQTLGLTVGDMGSLANI